jgi:uncharacterized membrane protein
VSRLASHFDPILLAFAPLWWLWPSPEMLLAVQALAIAAGALPVYRLARKHLGSARAGTAFALAYLLYPATGWLTLNEFHPVALACPLLAYAIWFLDEERLVPFGIFVALAIVSKEEIGLVVAGLGVWYAFAHRRRLAGAAIVACGLAATAVAVGIVIPHFHGSKSPFYGRYAAVGGSGRGIVEGLFTDPWRVATVAFDHRGTHYLLELVLPLAGLCLLAPLVLVAALPELALNLLSSLGAQKSIHFHYTAAEIPVLIAAAIFGARRLASHARIAAAIPTVAVLAALVANYRLGPVPAWAAVPGGQTLQAHAASVSGHDRAAAAAVRVIPADAVVSATNSLGAHLSARRRYLAFPLLADARWIAVDSKNPSYLDVRDRPPALAAIGRVSRNPRWQLVFARDGVLVFRRRA